MQEAITTEMLGVMSNLWLHQAEAGGRYGSHTSTESPEDLHANPRPFNIFINDLKDGIETQLIRSLHDTKLEGILAPLEDKIKMQSKLDELQRQT